MSDKPSKTKIYHDILAKKDSLTVLKKDSFNFEFPKTAFDRISKFYGNLNLNPISFVKFNKNVITVEFKKMKTVSHVLEEKEIANIVESLNNFAIVPKNFHEEYTQEQIVDLSPKMNNKSMKDIFKKAGIQWDLILDFCELQEISKEIHETSKVTVSYKMIENVFKQIPLLNIKTNNGEKIDFPLYSYESILKKSGIKLDHMLPYLNHEVTNIDRTEKNNEINPLNEKVKIRQLKERIKDGDLKTQDFDISIGTNECHRYNQIPFDCFENDMKEAGDLLNDLISKVNNKKDSIKKYYENVDNQIIEIKDKDNKTVYLRKKIFDKIISDPESNFDEYKTNDINGNEIIVSKNELLKSKDNPPLIKISNKNNPEKEPIFSEIKNIENIINNLKDTKKEEDFEGKNKNGESIKEKWLIMDLEGDELPKLDESKPLYTIPGKEKINNLIKKITGNNQNYKIKDIEGNTCFVSNNYIQKLKNESKDDKNEKYEINDAFGKKKIIINKEEIIKGNQSGEEFILIKNKKDNEQYLIELNNLLNNLKKYKSNDNELKLTNSVDNKEIKIGLDDIEIVPPFNNYPIQKIKDNNLNTYKEKGEIKKMINDSLSHKAEMKERLKQRISRARPHTLEKSSFTIRRAIITKKQKKILDDY